METGISDNMRCPSHDIIYRLLARESFTSKRLVPVLNARNKPATIEMRAE